MGTGQKKLSLREIVEKAPLEVKRRYSTGALINHLKGKEPSNEDLLGDAARSIAIETRDPELRFRAKEVLRELGQDCDSEAFEAAISLTPRMREKFADFDNANPALKGRDQVLSATALYFAIDTKDTPEKQIGRDAISSNEQSANVSLFHALVRLGALSMEDMNGFLNMQLELSSLRAKGSAPSSVPAEKRPEEDAQEPRSGIPEPVPETVRSPSSEARGMRDASENNSATPITCKHELRDALDAAVRKATASRPNAPAPPQQQNRAPRSPSSRPSSGNKPKPSPPKKKKKNGGGIAPWEEREEIQDTDDATELRNAGLKNKRMSKTVMYKLICVFCFRITGQKALIGERHTGTSLVKANLTRLVTGDKPLARFFTACWKDMERTNAIQTRKKKSSDISSLPSSSSGINDSEIAAVVDWALSENRRLSS